MRLLRALNSSVIDAVRDYLIPERDYLVADQVVDLKAFMKAAPDRFLAMTLWDDEAKLKAFLLGYIPPKRDHLFVVQAWADPDTYGTEWPHKLFDEVKNFAIDSGLGEIRAETTRAPKGFLRRWGFEDFSTILSYPLLKEDE